MKKLFSVEMTYRVVVVAEDAFDAQNVASNNAYSIVSDAFEPDWLDSDEIKSIDELPRGWEVDCIPYGGDGDKTINEYLEKE